MSASISPVNVEALSATDPVLVMTRIFDAPRRKVWEALTSPQHVKHWYGGHGFSSPLCEMDVRPGGHWRHVMRTPDGTEFPQHFIYREVTEPERLVWEDVEDGEHAPQGRPVSRREVTLEDLGDKTRWRLVVTFPTLAARDHAHKMGFARVVGEGTDKINDLVKSL